MRSFRLGVTGRRVIPEKEGGRIGAEVAALLAAAEAAVASVPPNLRPAMRLLSPLAEGADRIAARAALARGWRLDVLLPFPAVEYARDFDAASGSLEEFQALLGRSAGSGGTCRALEGRREKAADAYAAVGRTIAEASDLLLAVLDEAPSLGPGGTRDTVQAALARGVPAWWVHTRPGHLPVLLEDPAGLGHRAALERMDNARRLAARLGALVAAQA